MSRPPMSLSPRRRRFPRVSGDEPLAVGQSFTVGRFSPRERG